MRCSSYERTNYEGIEFRTICPRLLHLHACYSYWTPEMAGLACQISCTYARKSARTSQFERLLIPVGLCSLLLVGTGSYWSHFRPHPYPHQAVMCCREAGSEQGLHVPFISLLSDKRISRRVFANEMYLRRFATVPHQPREAAGGRGLLIRVPTPELSITNLGMRP